MGALRPPSHWLPRDDFLLKNAAEAGASLESLARGAVQFSRPFTVQELQERWTSLLYDPVVSEQASAKMLEFECLCAFSSNLNGSSFDNDKKDFRSVCGKRRTKSIKRYYYSMRKRIRNEAFLPSIDVDFLTGSSGNNNNFDNGDDCNPPPLPPDSSFFGDSLTDQFGFIDNSIFPNNEHNMLENISGTEFEVPLLNSPFGYSPSSEMPPDWNDFSLPVGDDIIIQSEPPKMEDQMGLSTPSTDDLLAQIDCILNTTSDDEMFPIENIENESYLNTYGSLLLDSPNGGGETKKEENDILPNEPSVQKAQLHYYGGDQVLLSSALSVNPACPELRNGVICCTLNTEDPDIPSNDDVFLPIRIPSTPLPSAVLCKYDEAYRPTLKSASNVQMNNRWSFTKMREKSNVGVPNIDTAGDVVTRNTSSNEGLKEMTSPRIVTTTTTLATRTTICALPAVASTTKKTIVGCSMDTPQKEEQCSHDPISNTSMLDQEDLYDGDSDGDLHDDDSDGDIPNFSDVEALILDMELSPDDRDIFYKKVAKYQHQQTKRTIMRLEQAADARLQRLIASQNAFAILYSRCSTHFIKKPEVLVGRGTADTEVDIDLRKEPRGNKISRRQAIIKINMDGAFLLQNVSKHLIHVNGKEILPRQSVHLTQSSLIEVRGMTFVFEMNRNQVKRFVDDMRHNQQN